MLCLGIESSCDETGLALVRDGTVLGNVLTSQVNIHALFGGVVPELASREHLRHIGPLFDVLVKQTGTSPAELDCVAVARGPGLLGSLLVGMAFAKSLALGLDIPLLGVNHLHAHLLVSGLTAELRYPSLGLLVSGGHTNLYRISSPWQFEQLGRTLDDAAGEAFDKVGKEIGIAYPGGRMMDRLASLGKADPALFTRPYLDNDNLDFSFSGLKTSAVQWLNKNLPDLPKRILEPGQEKPGPLADFCASFSLAVADTLCIKTQRALDRHPEIKRLIVAGGVAANSVLREKLERLMEKRGGQAIFPPPVLCTDNAVMIAYAGCILARAGYYHALDLEPIPRGRKIPDDMLQKV